MREAWANYVIKNGERERGARAEDSLFGDAQEQLQTFRAAFELCRKQFLAVEQVEHGVRETERAAELSAAAVEGNALLANFFEVDRDVGGVPGVVELDMDILFANGLEIASAREFREAYFQGVLIERVAFAKRDSPANESIVEFV